MIVEAYIKVYGKEKWITLTDEQKHDVVMSIVNELNNRLG